MNINDKEFNYMFCFNLRRLQRHYSIARMVKYLPVVIFIIFCASKNVFAGCISTGANNVITISPEPLVISQSLPIGTILGEYETPPEQEFWNVPNDCDLGIFHVFSRLYGIGSATTIDGKMVYPTSIPGIGVAFAAKTNPNGNCPYGSSYVFAYTANFCSGVIEDFRGRPVVGQAKVVFYKTGATGSGIVSEKVGRMIMNCDVNFVCNSLESSSEVSVLINNFSIITLTCDVSTPTLSFNMGDIAASKFGTEPGTILTEDAQTQELGLRCDPNLDIMATLSGTQNPDTSDDTVLALTGQGTAGVAKGVGVQVVYNGEPLQREQPLLLKHTEGGVETFPITLRYYQTQPVVSPGTANAAATLTLTYQ